MARHESLTVGKLSLAKERQNSVVLEGVTIAGGTAGANASLKITTTQAVEASAPTLSHKLKVNINGVEYWIGLDAV